MTAHPPPELRPHRHAFFFDLDGTLAGFQLRPELVAVPAPAREALAQLARCGVALAVVSGRALADIDRMLAPDRHPAAGIHGAERRDASGRVHRLPSEALPPPGMARELAERMRAWPGTFVEDKGMALALHYRGAPQCEAGVRALADEMARRHPHLRLQPGKFVLEFKPDGVDKGQAITRFLEEPPFAGLVPVFIGDDRTDENGFAVVNARGGISIKAGAGESLAPFRLADVTAVHQWLEALAGMALNDRAQPIR